MTAGSYCTYAVKFDGTVASVGEGSYGRLGHSHSDNARLLNNVESLQGEVFTITYVRMLVHKVYHKVCHIKVKTISCPTVQITTSLYMFMVRKVIKNVYVCVRR